MNKYCLGINCSSISKCYTFRENKRCAQHPFSRSNKPYPSHVYIDCNFQQCNSYSLHHKSFIKMLSLQQGLHNTSPTAMSRIKVISEEINQRPYKNINTTSATYLVKIKFWISCFGESINMDQWQSIFPILGSIFVYSPKCICRGSQAYPEIKSRVIVVYSYRKLLGKKIVDQLQQLTTLLIIACVHYIINIIK